jgi:CBS domain-containing protein
MNVGTLCRQDVVTIDPAESLVHAARLMRERHVGFLVVVGSNNLNSDLSVTGVLTDRDIVIAVVAKDADARSLRVGDVMTRNPLLAEESSSVNATVRLMREVGVRRVPVIGGRNELTGVLSLDDVLDSTAVLLGDIAGASRSEQKSERSARP